MPTTRMMPPAAARAGPRRIPAGFAASGHASRFERRHRTEWAATMLERLGDIFARFTERWLPDPMVIACGLTLFILILAIVAPGPGPLADLDVSGRAMTAAGLWLGGLWNKDFLEFALQMCVVLLTGYGLAKAPPATRFLHAVASRVGSDRSAVLAVGVVSCVGCWINWGLGLVAAGILAGRLGDEMRARGANRQHALIVAAAYSGMMIWHGGLSGSAPFRVAREGITLRSERNGVEAIPSIAINRTTFSRANLLLTAVLIVSVPLLLRGMAREDRRRRDAGGSGAPARVIVVGADEAATPAERVNRSRVLALAIALLGLVGLVRVLLRSGAAAIDLNFVNTIFLVCGLVLHRNLAEYVGAVAEGGRAVTGIILQFPLYSGIHALMRDGGIAEELSQSFVAASTWAAATLHVPAAVSFPVAAFLSAGLVNLFIPSGGGQWIVQGPIMAAAAKAMELPVEEAVMAVAYGDEWTNMVQPFWAIPLMGLTGVAVREFMGYCALIMLLAAPIFAVALLIF